MLKLLVEHGAGEHEGLQRFSRDARSQNILAHIAIAVLHERGTGHLHLVSVSEALPKGGSVALPAFKHTRFTANKLDHLTHCHTRRKTMWVHDKVRTHTLLTERHVFLIDDQSAHSFLAVTAAELVAHFGPPNLSHHNLDDEVVVLVRSDEHFVHCRLSGPFIGNLGGLEFVRTGAHIAIDQVALVHWRELVDKDVVRLQYLTYLANTVRIQEFLLLKSLVILTTRELTSIDWSHAFVTTAVAVSFQRAAGLFRY
mmetsp:Transcript_14838/g.20341  ORF Transcript_14838/g.20341 Transcript_14838/m.20341 type:complete len:255 (-) Transcript_14838:185-949(-)